MASNVADQWVVLPPQVAGTAATEIAFTSAAVKAVYPIVSRVQVKEWAVIVTTTFSANATDPVVALRRKPLITGSSVTIQSLTLGSSNTTLRKYTSSVDVVAAGGPGTVRAGPSLGGHTSALTADTDLTAGTVVLAGGTSSMPSSVLSPGDLLIVEVTTAATTGGSGVVVVRLEPAGEQYSTAYIQYGSTP